MEKVSPFKKWFGLIILSLALAIIIIDTTILNVSISTIIKDFQTDIQSIQWVISIYSLTLAALTITGGRLGDLYGRKKMFILGAAIFALGSFITSISNNVPTMIVGESIIEGIGAALMMPATASLLLTTFKGRERAIAFGLWGAVAGSAAALGPILGGYLTTNYSWRWGFRVNVIVVILLILGSFVIKDARDKEERQRLDWLGVILSSLGLLSLVFGIIEASTYGWWKAKELLTINGRSFDFWGGLSVTPYAIVLGLIILGLFIWWESVVTKRKQTPLVSLKLFANNQFTSGATTTMVLSLGQAGLFFIIPVFLQSVLGIDAYHTGLTLLPMSLTILIISPTAATLSSKITPKYLIQAGLLINALGAYLLQQSLAVDATSRSIAPGLMVFGIGMALVMSQINNLTLSAVSVQEAGEASGVNNTMRQLGSTLGAAVIGAVLLTSLSTNLTSGIRQSSVIPSNLKSQIETAVSKQTSNVEFGGGAHLSSDIPANINEEIVSIGHQATVTANQSALNYSIIFTLLGFLVSFWLPKVQNLEREESAAAKPAGQ